MREVQVKTSVGDICVAIDDVPAGQPIVFMHGVFLDKSLWTNVGRQFTGRPHICIDMPAHGGSSNVGRDWTLDDCVTMLMQVLDTLNVQTCIAVGHSWGSMTALRAAAEFPARFTALGLFNMPFRRASGMGRLRFILQRPMTVARRFYARQAARSLYSGELLRTAPQLSTQMQDRLSARPPREIRRTIDAVILNAEDATPILRDLRVPALAIVGEADYVGVPPGVDTITVPGGHVSPHEAPRATREAVSRVLGLGRSSASAPAGAGSTVALLE